MSILQESTFRPSVNYQPHKKLEAKVKHYLEWHDFIVHESTYHAVMPSKLINIIRYRFDLTSLYIRGRADRIAVHKTMPITFEWEAKTKDSQKYNDLMIELLPLAHHLNKLQLGVKCLYACNINGSEFGFWINELPIVRQVWIPPRKEYESLKESFIEIAQRYFNGVPITDNPTAGSGDPFVIIDNSEICELPHWSDCILDTLEEDF